MIVSKRLVAVVFFWSVASALVAGLPAEGAVTAGTCAVTGFTPQGGEAAGKTRAATADQRAEDLTGGTNLTGARTWRIAEGAEPVLVVDSTTPMSHGSAELTLFGRTFPLVAGKGTATTHFVSNTGTTILDGWTRRVGLSADGGACRGSLVVEVDRPAYTTYFGMGGLALFVIGILTAVPLARMRRGRWLGRFLLATPSAIVAGAGEAAVLHEAGVISPFSANVWMLPAGMVLLVGLLPLTRGRRSAVAGDLNEVAPAEATLGSDGPDPGAPQSFRRPQPAWVRRLVGAGIAVALVGAGIGAPAVLPASPASAKIETVTPTQARVIFDSLWADTKGGAYRHLDGVAKVYAGKLLDDKGFRGIQQPVTEVAIGIPSRQFGYPAYFVANAQLATEATEATGGKGARVFYSMFRRDAADQPWRMVEFRFGGPGNAVPVPKILPDGHLAPLPAVADLKLAPSGVGAAYATWYSRAAVAKKLPVDQRLSLPPKESAESNLNGHVGSAGRHDRVFSVITSKAEATQPELIPLANGSVLVSFSVNTHDEVYNNDRAVTLSCDIAGISIGGQTGRYRHVATEYRIYAVASIPLRSAPGPVIVKDNVNTIVNMDRDPCPN